MADEYITHNTIHSIFCHDIDDSSTQVDPGHLPPPVLAFHDVRFGYPNCEPLYTDVNFGVDLDSRIALVGVSCV